MRIILVHEGQVLLVRHTYHDGWLLPGGGVARGETPEQAARREAREETSADLGALELRGVYSNFIEGKSDHVIVIACQDFALSGEPKDRLEIAQCAFFPLDALPTNLLPGHRRRLEEWIQPDTKPGYGTW